MAAARAADAAPSRNASWISDLRRDVPYALRALMRTPGFTLLCILTIAVGIGANAAIFSVVNTVLLRPLPNAEPDRLLRVWESLKDQANWTGSVSPANLRDWQEQSRTIENFVAYQSSGKILDNGTEPERVLGLAASANLFVTLRAQPILGRTFAADEDQPGHNHVVVLSEAFFRRRFGADRSIIGHTLTLDGEAYTVIGVMPKTFAFPANNATNELWLPYTPTAAALEARGSHTLSVIARLRTGVSLESATTEMKAIAAGLEKQYPDNQANRTVLMVPLQQSMVGQVKPALIALLGAVALVLLIACANVANLLLARAASRRRDVAVRLALGASRSQLVRQYLTESVTLAVAGAALGTAGAWIGLKPLSALAGNALPVSSPITFDGQVLTVLLAVSVLCGVVFGLAPALQTSSQGLRDDLTGSGNKSTSNQSQQRARGALVVTQIALSLMLLVNAGLMMRAFYELRGTESGIASEHLVSMHLAIPGQYADSVLAQQIYRPVLEEIRSTPDVRAAGMISLLPIESWGANGDFWVDGRPRPAPGKAPLTELRQVSPGYFSAMGIPIKSGRDFNEDDKAGGGSPVLINEAMAREHFAGENPIGKAIRRNDDADGCYTIIGVVGDVRTAGLDRNATPETYYPYANWTQTYGSLVLVVRTTPSVESMIGPLRGALHKAAPMGLRLALVGIVTGLAAAFAMTRVLANMLYGVGTRDAATFTGVPLMLAGVAVVATLIPAWRASRVDPMRAIRAD